VASGQPTPPRPARGERVATPAAGFAARSRPVPRAANDNRAPLLLRLRPLIGAIAVIALVAGLAWLTIGS